MGLDVWSDTIIGIPVDQDLFIEMKTVKAFEHDCEDEKVKFCSKTGKKLWKQIQVLKKGIFDEEDENEDDEDFDLYYFLEDATVGGYKVSRIYSDSGEDSFYVSIDTASTDSHRSGGASWSYLEIPTKEQVDAFKAVMEEKGLWDPENFCIWTIQSVSC